MGFTTEICEHCGKEIIFVARNDAWTHIRVNNKGHVSRIFAFCADSSLGSDISGLLTQATPKEYRQLVLV